MKAANCVHARSKRGFTLIELLVVISIIGLLSSVVMAGLTNARKKANDSSIRQTLTQVRNLFELQRSSNGSYTTMFGTISGTPSFASGAGYYTFSTLASCTSNISNATLQNLCKSVYGYANGASNFLYIGGPGTGSSDTTWTNHRTFSVMAIQPSTGKYACVGTTGASDGNTFSSSDFLKSGCLVNP